MGSDKLLLQPRLVLVFQPTLPHGERHWDYLASVDEFQFQPTLPHGERRYLSQRWEIPTVGFNPRSRMGSDEITNVKLILLDVSTHAPAWGATVPGLREISD